MWNPAGAPWSTSRRGGNGGGPHGRIVHFHKVFKGFLINGQVLTIMVRSALWGGMQKHKDFLWFLEVPRRQPAGVCAVHGQHRIWPEI